MIAVFTCLGIVGASAAMLALIIWLAIRNMKPGDVP